MASVSCWIYNGLRQDEKTLYAPRERTSRVSGRRCGSTSGQRIWSWACRSVRAGAWRAPTWAMCSRSCARGD